MKCNQKLLSVTVQLKKLEQKKELCVNAQLEFENNFLSFELFSNRKYQKLIQIDFNLFHEILECKNQLSKIKAQISRSKKKSLLCN